MSAFYYDRAANQVYLSYSSFSRGVEDLECYFNWYDRIPLNGGMKDRSHPFYEWPVDESGRNRPDVQEKLQQKKVASTAATSE